MRMKHGSIATILIQIFVFSAMVGALSPTASATQTDADTTTSNPGFPELHATEDTGFDWFDGADDVEPEFVAGEVLVKFRTSISTRSTNGIVKTDIVSVDELNKRFEAKEIKKIKLLSNVYKLILPEDADILSIVKEYEGDPNVKYAQPNYIYQLFAVPNDAEYWRQWAHKVTQAELAWNITTGDPSVVIAILDSGVDYDHPDLAANIWINTAEYYGQEGVDDDNNGYIDDVRGWNFVYDNNETIDTFGHGTHCAGIAAAVTNNGEGVAGVSWNSKIMPVRIAPADSETVAQGIRYATNNSANIISMSFGIYGNDTAVYNEVVTAYNKGVLLVAAAGNEASSTPIYPAAWPEVIAVSATDTADNPAIFTNFGNWIEVAAPGVHIYSTLARPTVAGWSNAFYDYVGGTSMAAPYVAGVAALIWSRFGLETMTNKEVRFQLRNTTDDLGEPGFDIYYGYGRVNARWAVDHASPEHDLRAWGMEAPRILKPGNTTTINCTVLNFGKNMETNVNVQLLVDGEVVQEKIIGTVQPYEWANVSFSWIPQTEKEYNVTSYVVPPETPPEDFTNNNAKSTRVLVRVEEVVNVPQDFSMIQRAVSAVNSGYTIQVSSGTYYERVYIDKSLTLTGEGASTTIIDGGRVGWLPPGRTMLSTVHVYEADNVHISQFTTQNSRCGVHLEEVQNSIVSNNVLSNNTWYGVCAPGSYNSVINNTISHNGLRGVIVWGSHHSINGNTVSNNNGAGIKMSGYYSNINGNIVSNNAGPGVELDYPCRYSSITGNVVSNNNYGVYSYYGNAENNNIYHNNFINNTQQVYFYPSRANIWDDGYPSGGNYWSDYNGTDLYSGPYQNETGSDGIGDTPYVIDANNQDNYPLIRPWGSIQNVDTGLIYLTIQKAIDAPETLDGHTIEVKAGTYYENVVVDKSLMIVGEDPSTTIIDGSESSFVVYVKANNVQISQFTIQNGFIAGIYLGYSNYSTVSNNKVLHCTTWYGVYLANSFDNSVCDNILSSNSFGILLQDSGNNTISGNTMSNNVYGAYLQRSSSNIISGNTASNNDNGIVLFSSDGNTVSDNTITGDGAGSGIYLDGSSGNTFSGNTMLQHSYGIQVRISSENNCFSGNIMSNNVYGIYLYSSSNNAIYYNNFIDNTNQAGVSNSPNNTWDDSEGKGNYWSDYTGVDTDGDGIGDTNLPWQGVDYYPLMNPVIRVPQDYPTIQAAINAANDDTLIRVASGTYYENVVVDKPLMLIGEDPSTTIIDGGGGGMFGEDVVTIELEIATLSGFRIQNGRYGVYLYLCVLGSTISGNTISNNFIGVTLEDYSENCIIRNNFVSNCDFIGIYLSQADDNTITGNTLSNTDIQILGSEGNTVSDNVLSNSGIFLYSCTSTTVCGNAVSNSTYGVYIKYYGGNNVSGNTFSNNVYGISIIEGSSNNIIYHNNFIDNTVQAASPGGTNVWDDGYSSGGNYWSDYTGEDQDLDGIGDTPYVIDANNRDNYPLMHPWPVHDVAVIDVTATPTEVPSGESVSVIVTVRNQGTESETFDVTVYYNSNAIGTQTVTNFSARDSTMLNFTWNTTCVALGTYTIKAVASTVPGETDTDDNTKTDGTVTIWAWDLLDEPWNQLDGWKKEGKGQSRIETLDGKSCLYNKPDRAKYVTQWKDIGSLPETGYTVETSLYINSWGTGGSEAFVAFKFYDGMHLVTIEIHGDRVVGSQSQFSLQTQIQQWYTWRFVIDSDADTIYAYRDGQYVGTLTGLTDSTANDGLVYCSWTQNPKGSSGCESYTDYIKIATGLYTPS